MSIQLVRPRVAAVSYLNTVPLVWGLEHGPQRDAFDLQYCVPSECAERMRRGEADLGLIPVIEMARQGFDFCPGTGIACDGAVRSILLVSKKPPSKIRSLAVDAGSRTSVMLARLILDAEFGAQPDISIVPPILEEMLAGHDAALLIGDPALHIDPRSEDWEIYDLGAEWKRMTGLPMVFAVWSGPSVYTTPANSRVFIDSLHFGLGEIERIVAVESVSRGLSEDLVRTYLTRHIKFELGENEYEGLRTYLRLVARLEPDLALREPVTASS